MQATRKAAALPTAADFHRIDGLFCWVWRDQEYLGDMIDPPFTGGRGTDRLLHHRRFDSTLATAAFSP